MNSAAAEVLLIEERLAAGEVLTDARDGRPDLRYFNYTDCANAERLHAMYGRDFHWCSEMQKWLTWDGRRWAVDSLERMRKMAINTIRQFYIQAGEIEGERGKAAEKWARNSEGRSSILAMIDMAKAVGEVSMSAAALDQDMFLLNFLNGTLDLRTGELRPHRREDLITKLVHHDYNSLAKCPQFLAFLHRIMGRDPDGTDEQNDRADRLVSYLQKALGYSPSFGNGRMQSPRYAAGARSTANAPGAWLDATREPPSRWQLRSRPVDQRTVPQGRFSVSLARSSFC